MRNREARGANVVLRVATWGSLALAATLSGVAAWQAGSHPAGLSSAALVPLPGMTVQPAAAVGTAAPIATPAMLPPVQVRVYTEGELRRGETLALALDRQDVAPQLVNEIATA